jgi:hypothetical protein
MDTLYLVMIVLSVVAWLVAIGTAFDANKAHVDPGDSERAVIVSITGGMRVAGPGLRFPLPWESLFALVRINREPVAVADEPVKSRDAMLTIAYRFDMLAGREFDNHTGHLVPVTSIDDSSAVVAQRVKEAVTRVKYDERAEQIKQRVEAAVEAVLSCYTSADLMSPEDTRPQVPLVSRLVSQENEWMLQARDAETGRPLFSLDDSVHRVDSPSQLYERLGRWIQLVVNRELSFCGLHVVSFQVTNLEYRDPDLQRAWEMAIRRRKLEAAMGDADEVSTQELLALGTDQLGPVVTGEALKGIGRGVGRIGEGLGEIGHGLAGRHSPSTPTGGDD